ncbi:Uncharacterised protein [uncultured archaeon]|nr:Uncharacterised protein [uncultured archaeon]
MAIFLNKESLPFGMNYAKVVSSAVSWVSMRKVLWFLIFFWIALPVLVFLPEVIDKGLYPSSMLPLVVALYDILYLAVIVGVIVLIQGCLAHKHSECKDFSVGRLLNLIVLVFIELFYVFFWSIYKGFRAIQLLLIVLSVFVFYYYLASASQFIFNLFILSLVAYFIVVIYNAVRVFFSTSVFCSRNVSPVEAIKEAADLTKHNFYHTLTSILLSIVLAGILFSFVSLCLWVIASLVLSYFLINPIALSLGFKAAVIFALGPTLIAYHYSIIEVFSQLSAHRAASHSIKRILAHRVLHPKHKAPVRKLAKRKRRR